MVDTKVKFSQVNESHKGILFLATFLQIGI